MRYWFCKMCLLMPICGCATDSYRTVKELKTLSFSDDVSKGASAGPIESNDCVFFIAGYQLGDLPDLGRAVSNARTGKKSKVTDVAYASDGGQENSIRYVNDLTTKDSGFSAGIFGKKCVEVKGMGYK